MIEVRICKFATAKLLNSRISIVVNEYQRANVFNKAFAPGLDILLIGKFILFRSPRFFNHSIEAFNKMLAVLRELIDGTVIGVRFDFVPSEWLIVGKNI